MSAWAIFTFSHSIETKVSKNGLGKAEVWYDYLVSSLRAGVMYYISLCPPWATWAEKGVRKLSNGGRSPQATASWLRSKNWPGQEGMNCSQEGCCHAISVCTSCIHYCGWDWESWTVKLANGREDGGYLIIQILCRCWEISFRSSSPFYLE